MPEGRGLSVHGGGVFSLRSPKAPSGPESLGLTGQRPLEDILCRIDIPVVSHPAIRALPYAIGQR